MDKKSNTDNFIRGGQTFSLSIHMFFQNLKSQLKYLGITLATICLISGYFATNEIERKWTLKWVQSYAMSEHFNKSNSKTKIEVNGKKIERTWGWIHKNPSIIAYKESLIFSLKMAAAFSFLLCIFAIYAHTRYLIRRGNKATKDEHIRGALTGTKKELISLSKDLIRRYKKERGDSTLSVCDIPLVQGSETAGIATVGSPGVGKSETHIDIAAQLRSSNRKAIIYDLGGALTKKFYRPGKDIILNPLDERCAEWDVWSEGKSKQHYAAISEALIPDDGSDPIWYQAPRIVLTHVMKKLGEMNATPEMSHLQRILFRMDAKKLAGVLSDTDAKSVFNLDAEKMAGSIRSIIATYTESFTLLHSGVNSFSITDWVNDDEDDRWVFITCREVDRPLLAPLITVWFEIFSRAILSLEPSYARRVGCFLDELPTLQRIPSLENALNTGRKFGLVPVLGFQAKSQMNTTYGEEETKTILGAIPTYVAFRCNGINAAEDSAEELGKSDQKQASEGSTVGQADSRDAQSLNRQNNNDKKIVMASEIQSLQDLQCYFRGSRGLPITLLDIIKRNIPDTQKAFIERKNETLIDDDTLEPMGVIEDIDAYLDEVESRVDEEEQAKKDYLQSMQKNSTNQQKQGPTSSQTKEPEPHKDNSPSIL